MSDKRALILRSFLDVIDETEDLEELGRKLKTLREQYRKELDYYMRPGYDEEMKRWEGDIQFGPA